MKQRVLIVDDSAFIRRVLQDWVSQEPDMEVVGVAVNGQEAIQKVRDLRPDVLTLDIEMPVMDGLTALESIMREQPLPVVMVSHLTQDGAAATVKALELGALDFVPKPSGSTSLKFLGSKNEFLSKLRLARQARWTAPRAPAPRPVAPIRTTDKVVLIASSTGGPRALASLWASLPQGLPAPILVVQHMPPEFTDSFAKRLNQIGTVPCREAASGDRVTPGMALVAPGGKHMTVRSDGALEFSDDPPVHGVKPAADPLFLAAAKLYGARCVGVVLTGMGRDGAIGAVAIRKAGGYVLGEAESSCVIYGMPRAAKEAGGVDCEVPIDGMAKAIAESIQGRMARAS